MAVQALQGCVAAVTAQLIVMFCTVMSTDLDSYMPVFGEDVWNSATLPELSTIILTTLVAMRSTLDIFADASAKFYQIKKVSWCSEKIATLKMELETAFPAAKDWMFTIACAPVVTAVGAARRLRDVTKWESTEDTATNTGLMELEGAEASTGDTDDIPIHQNPRVKRRRKDTPRPSPSFRQRLRVVFGGATVTPVVDTEDTDDLAFASQPQEDIPPPVPPTLQLPPSEALRHADDLAAEEVASTLLSDDPNAAPDEYPRDSDALAPGYSPHPRRRRTKSGKVKFQRRHPPSNHPRRHPSPELTAPDNAPSGEHTPLDKYWDKILRAKLARLSKAALDIKAITNGVPVPPDRH